jgi:streptogramin lyase
MILAIWVVAAMTQSPSPSPSVKSLPLASAKVVASYEIPLHPLDGTGAPPSREVEFGGFSIAVAPNGDVWYTAPGGVGRLTPTGMPTWYSLAKAAGPGDIHLGPDGAMLFVEAGLDKVGRITTDGSISEFTGSPLLGDLNALGFDADGNVGISGTSSQYVAKMGR